VARFVEQVRPEYVDGRGLATMSDAQRADIDRELQANLQSARRKITAIKATFLGGSQPHDDAATTTTTTSSPSSSPTASSGGHVQQHRESAIQILLHLLHVVGQLVKQKRKDRLAQVVRQLQTKVAAPVLGAVRSVHWTAADGDDDDDDGGGGGGGGDRNGGRGRLRGSGKGGRHNAGRRAERFDDAELRELVSETVAMRASHETEMDEVRACQQRLAEIAEMMTEFTTHLALQTEVVADIQENAEASVEEISKANEYLRKTVDAGTSFRLFMVAFFLGTSLVMLAYDWVS
jgi:hypothetical protein